MAYIFFDIDGTLWDEKMQIPESTIPTIRQLQKNGHKTFLCSGRSRSNINDKRLLGIGFDGIVAAGGNTAENRKPLLKDFLIASNYAGIAFGNAGCGAVHALSYAHGGAFHIPHGEANFICFTEVFKMYMRKQPKGKIEIVNKIFADVLGCSEADVYTALDEFLGKIIEKKPLKEYGMTEDQVAPFAKSTVDNQQRLLGNNYVFLSEEEIAEIFANLY